MNTNPRGPGRPEDTGLSHQEQNEENEEGSQFPIRVYSCPLVVKNRAYKNHESRMNTNPKGKGPPSRPWRSWCKKTFTHHVSAFPLSAFVFQVPGPHRQVLRFQFFSVSAFQRFSVLPYGPFPWWSRGP